MFYLHFNDINTFVHPSLFCRACSKRFHQFINDFININFTYLKDLDRLKNHTMSLRNDEDTFIATMIGLLNIFKQIDLCLDDDFEPAQEDKLIAIHTMQHLKFPILKTDNEHVNAFNNDINRPLRYTDLDQLYKTCVKANCTRKDITNKGEIVLGKDIKHLQDKYAITSEIYTDILAEYRLNDVVYCDDYSMFRTILLNYLSFVYCQTCSREKDYFECIGEQIYMQSTTTTLVHNEMCHSKIYNMLRRDNFSEFRESIKNSLFKLKLGDIPHPYSYLWKGLPYYHHAHGIIPQLLEKAGIPEEHYIIRTNTYLNDAICGHPMASHGWYAESIEALEEVGYF